MAYAENLSVNGTTLVREYPAEDGSNFRLDHELSKSMGPVLLQDGDRLYFSKSTFVQYNELNPNYEFNMPFIMECEVKVGCLHVHGLLRYTHFRDSVSNKSMLSSLVSLALVAKVRCLLLGTATLVNK